MERHPGRNAHPHRRVRLTRRGCRRGDRRISAGTFNTSVSRCRCPAPRSSIRTSFSRLLLESRHRVGMSHETLSELAQVSRGQIAKIELGQARSFTRLRGATRRRAWPRNHAGREAADSSSHVTAMESMRHAPATRIAGSEPTTGKPPERSRSIQRRSRGWIDLLAFDARTGYCSSSRSRRDLTTSAWSSGN